MRAILIITRRGTVTLPAKLRDHLGLKAGGLLTVETTPDGILLRSAAPSMIAVTALEHDLTVATRNVRDFKKAGVKVVHPFVVAT